MSRALIIENHHGLRVELSKILTGMGIESIGALSINEVYKHDIDLIIMGILAGKNPTQI